MAAPLVALLAMLQLDSVPARRPLMAIGQTIAINTFVNRVDAWVFMQDWARAGTRAWGKNLERHWTESTRA